MVDATQIRNQIQSKIFTPFGQTVTLKVSTPTYNTRGDKVSETVQSTSITCVPYDINSDRRMYNAFSTVNAGDFFAAVPYTVAMNQGDLITMDSVDWEIKEIMKHYLPTNLVYVIRLAKVIA